jgi:hypothetical protein
MAILTGAANKYGSGAQEPDPAPNQKGHEEMGGERNAASTGRNDPLPGAHPLTGTELPSRSGGDGNIMRGGRGRGN